MDLVREYRAHLYADVVTGKRSVREAFIVLPDVEPRNEKADDSMDSETRSDYDELNANCQADRE